MTEIREWRHGKCEAGLAPIQTVISRLPPCDRRGRWMIQGIILCGTCARQVRKDIEAGRWYA